jgi:aminomethyltransferase
MPPVQALLRTPLYGRHRALGARMVAFAGWEMPLQYEGISAEHLAVRRDCGVFDVCHMGELEVEGPRAKAFLQACLSNDLDRIAPGRAQYTLLTNERGGIVDDLIAYQLQDQRFLLVVNAANRHVALAWLKEREEGGVAVRDVSDQYGLLAVQGPRSLARLALPEAPAFTFQEGALEGIPCLISRTGYTGEEGVELLAPAAEMEALWQRVLERGARPCGLGARDSLRIEACYPLHGQDIGPDTDAISAGLGWACALEKEFCGVEELRRLQRQGPERRLVPFVMEEPAVPRPGMAIREGGVVTSGTHSPLLDRGIGLGYVASARARAGEKITIDVRGRARAARVVEKPIYRGKERRRGRT